MTDAERLTLWQTVRDNTLTELAELSTEEGRRMTYSVNGQSVDWNAYESHLWARLATVDAAIGGLDSAGTMIVTALR